MFLPCEFVVFNILHCLSSQSPVLKPFSSSLPTLSVKYVLVIVLPIFVWLRTLFPFYPILFLSFIYLSISFDACLFQNVACNVFVAVFPSLSYCLHLPPRVMMDPKYLNLLHCSIVWFFSNPTHKLFKKKTHYNQTAQRRPLCHSRLL